MLKQIAKSLYQSALEEVGIPAGLSEVIREYPSLRDITVSQKSNASSSSSLDWKSLGTSERAILGKQAVIGWANSMGEYSPMELKIPALQSLIHCKVTDGVSCNITDIQAIARAKSDLSQFADLDEFARKRCDNLLSDKSTDGMLKLLEHDQIRCLGDKPSDLLVRHGWDDRLILVNDGGAHHFAAARYIAKLTGSQVPITTRLVNWVINPLAVDELRSQFDIFAVAYPDDNPKPELALQASLKSLKASFFVGALPGTDPQPQGRALFLPRNDRRSQRIASLLRESGFQDIGVLLREHLDFQLACEQRSKASHVDLHEVHETTRPGL